MLINSNFNVGAKLFSDKINFQFQKSFVDSNITKIDILTKYNLKKFKLFMQFILILHIFVFQSVAKST